MKTKLFCLLFCIIFCQSCSVQPKVIKAIDAKNLTVWTKSIEEFVAYRGSLYKPEAIFNEGYDYIRGELTEKGIYIKVINHQTKEEIWKKDLEVDSITNFVFDKTNMFFGTSLGLYFSLDKKTGEQNWSFKSPEAIYGFNNIHEKSIIFRDINYKLYSLDKDTGNLNWTFELSTLFNNDFDLLSGPTYASGVIFYSLNQGILLGINASTGEEKWRTEFPCHQEDRFLVSQDLIVLLSQMDKQKVLIQTFQLQTGQRSWSQKIELSKDGLADIVPFFMDNMLILNYKNTNLLTFHTKTGAVLKKIDLTPYQFDDNPSRKFWIINKNFVYFLGKEEDGTGSVLYSYNVKHGKISWAKSIGSQKRVSIKLAGKYVFISLKDKFLVLSSNNGNEVKNISFTFDYDLIDIENNLIIISNSSKNVPENEFAIALQWKK